MAAKRKAQAQAAKPAKKAASESANNLLWETFNDLQMSVEDVAEGMARILAYDSDALEQVVLFLAKLAGLKGAPTFVVKNATATAKELEKLCEGAVANYPLATAKLGHRFAQLLPLFVHSLHAAQSEDSIEQLLPILEAVAKVHLRSLRHVAIEFAAGVQIAAKEILAAPQTSRQRKLTGNFKDLRELVKKLDPLLKAHMDDVSPQIRALVVSSTEFAPALLNDESPVVRVAALEQIEDLEKLEQKTRKRVQEIAEKDVDLNCRVAAVNVVADVSKFLTDPEAEVAAAAARRFLDTHELKDVEKLTPASARALAQTSKLSLDAAVELVKTNPVLIDLIPGICESTSDKETLTASLLEHMQQMCSTFAGDAPVLAKVLKLFKFIDMDAVTARNLESDVVKFFKDACFIYRQLSDPLIVGAFAQVARPLLASRLDAEARTEMNELVEHYIKSRQPLHERAAMIAGLGRFVDVGDFASEEVWAMPHPAIEEYALSVAFNGDTEVIERALEYLEAQEPVPADKLMKVLIAATVRDLDLKYKANTVPLDKVAKSTVAAAAACGLI